jgi:hypothetical protein
MRSKSKRKSFGVLAFLGLAFAAITVTADEQKMDRNFDSAAETANSRSHVSRRYQTANVFDALAGPGQRLGAAWLVRTRDGIRGRIMTNVPTAGDPYTLWAVVYNNPSACIDGCNDEDLFNPRVRGSVYNLSGAISSSNSLGSGVINIDFELLGGKLPNDLFVLLGHPKGLLRNRGFKAEIVLVVDQHPPIVPGEDSWIADLTTTNFPGMGAATSIAVAVFVACGERSCPESVL